MVAENRNAQLINLPDRTSPADTGITYRPFYAIPPIMAHIPIAVHAVQFLQGFRQAFAWQSITSLILSSQLIQRVLAKTVVLNGVIYLGLLLILDNTFNTPDHTLFGYSYSILTGYPMYLICIVINARFFSQIAKEAFRLTSNQYRATGESISTATTIGMAVFYINCAAFAACIRWLVPWIGPIFSFLVSCIFMAYYCFDYKWMHLGWSLDQRLLHIERHWSYFLGFGLPATMITFFLSTLHAGAVFALIYPTYIIMATVASMDAADTTGLTGAQWALPAQVPVFWAVGKATHGVISVIQRLGVKEMRSAFSENKDHLGKIV